MYTTANTLIFDFDGTLADSLDLIIALYNGHAQEYGYEPLSRDELPHLRQLGYRKAMKAKNVHYRRVPKIIAALTQEMHARMDEVQPCRGIVEALRTLQQEGYRLGVLTSNQVPLVTEFFSRHAFPDFDFVVSERTLFGKGKALKRIMKAHTLDRQSVVYVGDEPRDVSASRKAGVRVIGVSWGIGGPEGFADDQPDLFVTTADELITAAHTLFQA